MERNGTEGTETEHGIRNRADLEWLNGSTAAVYLFLLFVLLIGPLFSDNISSSLMLGNSSSVWPLPIVAKAPAPILRYAVNKWGKIKLIFLAPGRD